MNANHEAFLIVLKYSHYYHVKGNMRVRNWWTIVTMNAIKHMIKVLDCVDNTYSNNTHCIQYRLIGTKAEQISTFLTQELFSISPSIILWPLLLLYAC